MKDLFLPSMECMPNPHCIQVTHYHVTEVNVTLRTHPPQPPCATTGLRNHPPLVKRHFSQHYLVCSQSCVFMAVGRSVVTVAQKFRFAGRMLMHVR